MDVPDRLAAELDTVPDHKTFATVDEVHQRLARLADDHPGVATLRRIGTSRLGDPMLSSPSATAPATRSSPPARTRTSPSAA
ncbi:hypothetical protein HCN51_46150 [Nonomuraea sp. FMUSA5-5]|uniref:FXSXX-COOH protein n=1 Tax=Nonomuraea composti TaxID=2720023 RepID=A0ABX1BGC4_9ACTN|nr:hypothetical protein [Nonomuraea sp. FMUSA5-5]NJP96731.1 hypothetical protein [Nonomuraea sp. FMUSA5-5]